MKREDLPPPAVLPAPAAQPRHTTQRILAIEHRAPALVHFRVSRPPEFRFTPGHYGRLGLPDKAEIVWRPYSIASAAPDPHLDFQLTCAPEGRFTSLFCGRRPGDDILVDARSFGFLTLDIVAPGGTLWMLGTGTGVAPYLAMLADARTWQRHERVVLAHSVRNAGELVPDAIAAATAGLDAAQRARLTVLPIVTREEAPGALRARIGALLQDGRLEEAGGAKIDAESARVMLCGNPEMIKEMRALLRDRGLEPGRRGIPGQLATEGYW
jgi:ferredoxin--NADP+ reductase